MKFAIANAYKIMEDRVVILFFFSARGVDLEKSTIGTYRLLLLQLLNEPRLQHVFDSLGLSTSNMGIDHQWSFELLKTMLRKAIKRLRKSSVVCFIDALDECEERQIQDIVSFFKQIGELTLLDGIRFWIYFASRHYPHITIQKGLGLVLERQEGHDRDIADYLESKLKIGKS